MVVNNDDYKSAALLNSVLESTADGILVVSSTGKVITSNGKFQKMWKIPDSVYKTLDDEKLLSYILDQLSDPELFLKKVEELYKKPEEESLDIVEFTDGRIFERFSAPYRMGNEILGRVWSFSDVTLKKITEETLQKERILFRTIIDNIPDAIYAKDNELRKTLANPADLHNMGCNSLEEALGKTDHDYFPKESADAFTLDDKMVMSTGNPVENREENFVDKEGMRKWLLTTKVPLKDSDGNITGIIGIGHDITMRKRNEMIREALYDISESVLITNDMTTLYRKIHQAVSNLMPAKNFFIAIYDDEKNLLSFPYMVDEFDPPFQTKRFGRGLTEYIIKRGKPELIDAHQDLELREKGEVELVGTPAAIWLGVPLKDEDKVFGVVVLQDYENAAAYGNDEMQLLGFISEQIALAIIRKRNAESIQKYAAELKELNQTKDKFFSIIAHDLKNPFVTLLGFSEMLLADYKDLHSDEVLFYINEMKKSADLSHNLLQNLLLWARSQTERIEIRPKKIELAEMVKQNILLLKKTAENKEITLQNNVNAGLFVYADEDMLNTIIRNLLTNSIKFTGKNGLISVSAQNAGSLAEISINDTGVGMTQEIVDRLFRLDINQSSRGTENESGTGLGLILCKEFVEKNGGTIWVKSQPGVGSTFSFTLSQV